METADSPQNQQHDRYRHLLRSIIHHLKCGKHRGRTLAMGRWVRAVLLRALRVAGMGLSLSPKWRRESIPANCVSATSTVGLGTVRNTKCSFEYTWFVFSLLSACQETGRIIDSFYQLQDALYSPKTLLWQQDIRLELSDCVPLPVP